MSWIPHLQEVIKSFANKISLLKKSQFLPRHVCESFYLKVIRPSTTYAMPVWGGVIQTELFKALERQQCRVARIIFGFSSDKPTTEVLSSTKWNSLTRIYKLSLIKLLYKGYIGALPHALVEQLINYNTRSASRLRHGLIAPSFTSKYMQNSIAYRGAVLWNAIGRSHPSLIDRFEHLDIKSFLKNVANCYTFRDLNFNVLAPQIINNRFKDFTYF